MNKKMAYVGAVFHLAIFDDGDDIVEGDGGGEWGVSVML
jgi:hypothetical protein